MRKILKPTLWSLLIISTVGCLGGSGSGDPHAPSRQSVTLDNCRIKARGDIIVEKFKMDLSSHGRDVYKSYFEAYNNCN